MFELQWTAHAAGNYHELKQAAEQSLAARKKKNKKKSTKPEGLFKQVKKAIDQLASNPKHPGLNTHEYTTLAHPFDAKGKVFEVYAQNQTPGAYRVFWCYGPETRQITIIAITPHP